MDILSIPLMYIILGLALVTVIVLPLYFQERGAIKKGMMRPRKGMAIVMSDEGVSVLKHGKVLETARKDQVTQIIFTHDDLHDNSPGIADSLKLMKNEQCLLQVEETADGFYELLDWSRRHPKFQTCEIRLS